MSDKLEYFYAKQVYTLLPKKLSYSNLQLSPPPVLFLSSGLPRGLADSVREPPSERETFPHSHFGFKKKKKSLAKSSRASSNLSVIVLLIRSSFFFSDCIINLLSFSFFHLALMHLPDVGITERFNHEIQVLGSARTIQWGRCTKRRQICLLHKYLLCGLTGWIHLLHNLIKPSPSMCYNPLWDPS